MERDRTRRVRSRMSLAEGALLAAGLTLLAIVGRDVFITSLTLRGGGSLVIWIARGVWRTALALHRRRASHRLLTLAGGLTAASTLLTWMLLLWGGWSLVFAAAGPAIVDTSTGEPAGLWTRVYYAGFNIFTLGLGDYRPIGAAWQLATAGSAAVGLVGATLAITYLVPTLSAAVQRQSLAGQIWLLGATPHDVARAAARDPDAFASEMSSLRSRILDSARQHLAYPILNYFHAEDPRFALPLRLAVLHEGILLAACGLRNPAKAYDLERDLATIGLFLDSVTADGPSPPRRSPPPPSLAPLARDGLETVTPQVFEERLQSWRHQREAMLTLLIQDGWLQADVHAD